MTNTTHLNIPLVQTAQAQKEVTVNEAISRIDAILNTGAIDKDLTTPPGSPSEGDVYIVAASATGDWNGEDGNIAYFNQIWRFITPREGISLWVNDEDAIYSYNGSSWTPAGGGIGLQSIHIPASQIIPSASGGCASLAATSMGAGAPDIHTLNFDAASTETAEFSVRMPKRWNGGGGNLVIEWSHSAAATNFDVVWGVQTLSIGAGDSLAASFSTADTATVAGGATNTLYTATISNVTIYNSPVELDTLYFRLSRVGGDAADSLAVDARLHGLSFHYYSDAATDD